MTDREKTLCNSIIHAASAAAGGVGAGLAQVPCSDNALISPIQLAMTVSLGSVFGITMDQSAAKAALASTVATKVGRGAVQVMVGWLPGVGNAINATTAAAVTELIGWTMAKEFEREAKYMMCQN